MNEVPIRGFLKIAILYELQNKEVTSYELLKILREKLPKEPSPGSIYPIINELKEKGYVIESDGNKKLITLSDKGKSLLKELIERSKQHIKEKLKILQTYNILDKSEIEEIEKFFNLKKDRIISLYKIPGFTKLMKKLSDIAKENPEKAKSLISKFIQIIENEE